MICHSPATFNGEPQLALLFELNLQCVMGSFEEKMGEKVDGQLKLGAQLKPGRIGFHALSRFVSTIIDGGV